MEIENGVIRLTVEESRASGLPERVAPEDFPDLHEQFNKDLRVSNLTPDEIAIFIRRASILKQIDEEFGSNDSDNTD